MAVILIVLCLMTGCLWLGNYGSITVASGKWDTTIQELTDNWEEYDISYAGLSYENPSAVMFGSKKGGKRIIGDKWTPVTDREVLKNIIEWLNANVNFPPTLWEILGPKGRFFGYIYTSAREEVVIKAVDDNTLLVENIPLPPIDYSGGGYTGR